MQFSMSAALGFPYPTSLALGRLSSRCFCPWIIRIVLEDSHEILFKFTSRMGFTLNFLRFAGLVNYAPTRNDSGSFFGALMFL